MRNQKEKNKLIEHYQKSLRTMINDKDFTRYFGVDVENKILKYSQLANYQTINELLPEDKDFRIILTESKSNEGHWCCILKYNNVIEWFDSYGCRPDGELSFISKTMKLLLGENKHYLSRLLNTKLSNQNVIYNKTRFQVLDDGINTCGKWTILRILMMKFGYNLNEFVDFMKRQQEETGKPYDILVCDWIK